MKAHNIASYGVNPEYAEAVKWKGRHTSIACKNLYDILVENRYSYDRIYFRLNNGQLVIMRAK